MVKAVSTDAIERATDTPWRDWCAHLDKAGGKVLDHKALVRAAREFKEISGWWAQGIAVAYEQHIGRRKPGQSNDGSFAASVSRTVALPQQDAFDAWCAFALPLTEIGDCAITGTPGTSSTPKWRYWRCQCEDGSRASVNFSAKDDGRARVGVEHGNLADEALVEKLRSAWAELLRSCFKDHL